MTPRRCGADETAAVDDDDVDDEDGAAAAAAAGAAVRAAAVGAADTATATCDGGFGTENCVSVRGRNMGLDLEGKRSDWRRARRDRRMPRAMPRE